MTYQIPPRGTDTSINATKNKQQLDREFRFMEDVAESLDITVRDLIKEIQTGDVGRVIPLFLAHAEIR